MKKDQLRLRALRAAQEPKLSQSQLARKAGLGVFRYWQIENGEGPPSTPAERLAIATVLGGKVTDIAWPEFANEKAKAS